MGRCDGISFVGLDCFGGGMATLENGRNEFRMLEIGGGCCSCASAPLMRVMNLL